MTDAALPRTAEAERRAGLIAAAGAYVMWGILPLYLKLIAFVDVREVLAQRILWCVPSALAAVFLMSGWRRGLGELGAALRPRMLLALSGSALLIFCNWGIYVYLVVTERVIEASLAYFLAPLVGVGVGVALFGERIGPAQTGALAFAAAGVAVQGFATGAPPWAALLICFTWSAYAVIRKRAPVSSATGLLVESSVLAPVAVGLLLWTAQTAPLAFSMDWSHAILLALAGPVTALPLLAFAFGARRVSFVTLGLLQFLAPSLQFLTGLAFGEPFTLLRALGFALIWIGLILFVWDSVKNVRRT